MNLLRLSVLSKKFASIYSILVSTVLTNEVKEVLQVLNVKCVINKKALSKVNSDFRRIKHLKKEFQTTEKETYDKLTASINLLLMLVPMYEVNERSDAVRVESL